MTITTTCHSWNTSKVRPGCYQWQVSSYVHPADRTILQEGFCETREKAARRAKKWVRFYRRGQTIGG